MREGVSFQDSRWFSFCPPKVSGIMPPFSLVPHLRILSVLGSLCTNCTRTCEVSLVRGLSKNLSLFFAWMNPPFSFGENREAFSRSCTLRAPPFLSLFRIIHPDGPFIPWWTFPSTTGEDDFYSRRLASHPFRAPPSACSSLTSPLATCLFARCPRFTVPFFPFPVKQAWAASSMVDAERTATLLVQTSGSLPATFSFPRADRSKSTFSSLELKILFCKSTTVADDVADASDRFFLTRLSRQRFYPSCFSLSRLIRSLVLFSPLSPTFHRAPERLGRHPLPLFLFYFSP